MASGAEGVISVASNLLPREITKMVHLARDNDFAAAGKIHRRLYPLFQALFVDPNPVPLKAALAKAGIISNEAVRLPLCTMGPVNRALLNKVLAGLKR
jgi:4-hydroxy-tetrahydrodipicolinate synthase